MSHVWVHCLGIARLSVVAPPGCPQVVRSFDLPPCISSAQSQANALWVHGDAPTAVILIYASGASEPCSCTRSRCRSSRPRNDHTLQRDAHHGGDLRATRRHLVCCVSCVLLAVVARPGHVAALWRHEAALCCGGRGAFVLAGTASSVDGGNCASVHGNCASVHGNCASVQHSMARRASRTACLPTHPVDAPPQPPCAAWLPKIDASSAELLLWFDRGFSLGANIAIASPGTTEPTSSPGIATEPASPPGNATEPTSAPGIAAEPTSAPGDRAAGPRHIKRQHDLCARARILLLSCDRGILCGAVESCYAMPSI